MFAQKDFEIEDMLCKPLMAHLSTVDDGAPRDSPVWFLWEDSCLWIFGTSKVRSGIGFGLAIPSPVCELMRGDVTAAVPGAPDRRGK